MFKEEQEWLEGALRRSAVPADADDELFLLLIACVVSRLSALGSEFGVAEESSRVKAAAMEIVDDFWLVAAGEPVKSQRWNVLIDDVYEQLGGLEAFAIVVGVAGHLVRRGDSARPCWELAVSQLFDVLIDPVLDAWQAARFPGPFHQGAVKIEGQIVPPWMDEQLLVRTQLPLIASYRSAVEADLAAVVNVDERVSHYELRAAAERSGHDLGQKARRSHQAKFPGPDAPFDDVAALLRSMH